MAGLDPNTRSLLASLLGWSSLEPWVHTNERKAMEVLRSLGEEGSAEVVPHLAHFVFESLEARRSTLRRLFSSAAPSVSVPVTSAALEALAAILSRTSLRELPEVGRVTRGRWPYGLERTWASRDRRLGELPPVLLEAEVGARLLTFHASGYVREAGLELLVERDGDDDLPYLLLRANDWVPQIRDRARQAVLERCVPGREASLVRSFPLVARLEVLRRTSHDEVVRAVHERLRSPEGVAAVLAGVRELDPHSRRVALRLLEEAADVPWRQVFDDHHRDVDVGVRAWCTVEATRRLVRGDAIEFLRTTSEDVAPTVRIEALRGLMRLRFEGVDAMLEAALLDHSASVRHFARFHLRDRGAELDFADRYRGVLRASETTRELRAALSGLGEVGSSDDFVLVQEFLGQASSRTVRKALVALHALDQARSRQPLLELLFDARPSVRRAAAMLAGPAMSDADLPWLLENAEASGEGTATMIARVARRLPLWSQLRVLLRLRVEGGTPSAKLLRDRLDACVHEHVTARHVPRPPTAEEYVDLMRWLAAPHPLEFDPVLQRLERAVEP